MQRSCFWFALPVLFISGGCGSISSPEQTTSSGSPQRAALDLPGARADGAIRLPNQWFLRPVGKQVLVGDFPVNIAIHPSGKFAAVLHSGYGQHEIIVLELPGGKLVSRTALDEAFYGLAFSPNGKRVFASGAGSEVVHAFTFADGYLSGTSSSSCATSSSAAFPQASRQC
jgi:WD40 repeat protein